MKKLAEVLKDWEAVIGLEVHTELTTLETKMFCNCRLSHDDEPNTNVCPVCLGMPGALPVPNEKAIESIVMAGLATNCQIMRHSMFYRKHYFYPDMAKNFQTTQGPVAFCMHGQLDLEVSGAGAKERPDSTVEKDADGGYVAPIRILRIHMEEDAAKMVHVGGEEGRIGGAAESLIDYNRCGTPLIELVTEPDLRTPEEARLFMEKLRQTFLTLGISDCSLESGSMRCDGNISLRRRGETKFGTKTEMKNINSFKSLHDALEYEICRQAEVLEEGGEIYQETRHWEPSRKRTVVMRTKETADDYRFFPDPDLAPFDLTDEFALTLDWNNSYGFDEDSWTLAPGHTIQGKLAFAPSDKFDMALRGWYAFADDRTLLPDCWTAGAVFQYYPLNDSDDLRLHACVAWNSALSTATLSIGARYNLRFKLF